MEDVDAMTVRLVYSLVGFIAGIGAHVLWLAFKERLILK